MEQFDAELIGERIKSKRKLLGMSQEKFSELTSFSQSTVSLIENGRKGSGIDSLSKLEYISQKLNIPLKELIFGTDMDQNQLWKNAKLKKIGNEEQVYTLYHNIWLTIITSHGFEDEADYKEFISECGECIKIGMTLFEYDDLIICFTKESDIYINADDLKILAFIGKEYVGIINGIAISTQDIFYDPDLYIKIDSIAAVYADEYLVMKENLFPSLYINNRKREKYTKETVKKANAINTNLKRNYQNQKRNIILFDDVFVHVDYRNKGICTKMMEILTSVIPDFTGIAMVTPYEKQKISIDFYTHMPNNNLESEHVKTNIKIAKKLGWDIDYTFTPDATADDMLYAYCVSEKLRPIAKEAEFLKATIRKNLCL